MTKGGREEGEKKEGLKFDIKISPHGRKKGMDGKNDKEEKKERHKERRDQ